MTAIIPLVLIFVMFCWGTKILFGTLFTVWGLVPWRLFKFLSPLNPIMAFGWYSPLLVGFALLGWLIFPILGGSWAIALYAIYRLLKRLAQTAFNIVKKILDLFHLTRTPQRSMFTLIVVVSIVLGYCYLPPLWKYSLAVMSSILHHGLSAMSIGWAEMGKGRLSIDRLVQKFGVHLRNLGLLQDPLMIGVTFGLFFLYIYRLYNYYKDTTPQFRLSKTTFTDVLSRIPSLNPVDPVDIQLEDLKLSRLKTDKQVHLMTNRQVAYGAPPTPLRKLWRDMETMWEEDQRLASWRVTDIKVARPTFAIARVKQSGRLESYTICLELFNILCSRALSYSGADLMQFLTQQCQTITYINIPQEICAGVTLHTCKAAFWREFSARARSRREFMLPWKQSCLPLGLLLLCCAFSLLIPTFSAALAIITYVAKGRLLDFGIRQEGMPPAVLSKVSLGTW